GGTLPFSDGDHRTRPTSVAGPSPSPGPLDAKLRKPRARLGWLHGSNANGPASWRRGRCVAVCRRKLLALGPARNGPGDPPGCQQYERLRLGYASDIVHLTDRKT